MPACWPFYAFKYADRSAAGYSRFVDQEIAEALTYHMRDIGVVLHLGEEVVSIDTASNGKVYATFKSGKRVFGDALLYAAGRQGATANIDSRKSALKQIGAVAFQSMNTIRPACLTSTPWET